MKRLLIIAGAMLALTTTPLLAQQQPGSDWAPPGCGYGGSTDPKCKQNPDGSWPGQPQGGWPGQPPPQGGWPQQGSTQPPPGQQQPPPGTTWTPQQVMCPANSVWDVQAQRCLFKKAETPTQQRC